VQLDSTAKWVLWNHSILNLDTQQQSGFFSVKAEHIPASPTLILDHQCYLWAFHGHKSQYNSFNRLSSGKLEWQMHIFAEGKVGYQQTHYAEDRDRTP
jgi:hypothetical protein